MGRDKVVTDTPFRAGFACFVGRPNAGKSTLTNALVGQKVAITSNRPQTTRHAVRGIVHREDAQLILVDTRLAALALAWASGSTTSSATRSPRSTSSGSACLPTRRWAWRQVHRLAARVAQDPVVALVTKVDKVRASRWRPSCSRSPS